jgi:hypothetical protein
MPLTQYYFVGRAFPTDEDEGKQKNFSQENKKTHCNKSFPYFCEESK